MVLPTLFMSMLRIGVGGGGGFMFGGRGGATVGRPIGIKQNRWYDRFLKWAKILLPIGGFGAWRMLLGIDSCEMNICGGPRRVPRC